jgi:hypothetical protein
MWTRSACAGALVALALAALPASAGAQSVSDFLERLAGAGTSTTPAATTPTVAAPTVTPPAVANPVDPAAVPVAPPADAAPTPAPPAAEQPAAGVSDAPIAAATKQDEGSTALPAVLVALMGLGVVLALGALAWAVARWLAFDPRRVQRWRHAGREASYRASGVWADFADWVRLGR